MVNRSTLKVNVLGISRNSLEDYTEFGKKILIHCQQTKPVKIPNFSSLHFDAVGKSYPYFKTLHYHFPFNFLKQHWTQVYVEIVSRLHQRDIKLQDCYWLNLFSKNQIWHLSKLRLLAMNMFIASTVLPSLNTPQDVLLELWPLFQFIQIIGKNFHF